MTLEVILNEHEITKALCRYLATLGYSTYRLREISFTKNPPGPVEARISLASPDDEPDKSVVEEPEWPRQQ